MCARHAEMHAVRRRRAILSAAAESALHAGVRSPAAGAHQLHLPDLGRQRGVQTQPQSGAGRVCHTHHQPGRWVCVCVCPNMLKFNQASCLHVIRQVKLILTKCLENSYLNCNNISQYYCFYCIFGQINSALVSIRDFKIIKSLNYSELLTGSILYFSPNPQWKHFTRLNFTHIITYGELQYDLSATLQTVTHM